MNLDTKYKPLPLFARLAAFNFLDLLGAEDQHAVFKAAQLTRGGFSRTRRHPRLLRVPCRVGDAQKWSESD